MIVPEQTTFVKGSIHQKIAGRRNACPALIASFAEDSCYTGWVVAGMAAERRGRVVERTGLAAALRTVVEHRG